MARRRRTPSAHASRRVLVGGLTILVLGVGVAIVRHERENDRAAAVGAARQAKISQALRQVLNAPPRVEVTYVAFPLPELPSLTGATRVSGGTYEIIPTAVARRITSGSRPLRPAYDTLPHDSSLAAVAEGYAQGRLEHHGFDVIALLVTRLAPTRPTRIRLAATQVDLAGYTELLDGTDIVPDEGAKRSAIETRPGARVSSASISWTATNRSPRAVLPLAVIDAENIPQTHANAQLVELADGFPNWRLTSGTVLAPRRLYVGNPGGHMRRVSIDDALGSPMDLTFRGRRVG